MQCDQESGLGHVSIIFALSGTIGCAQLIKLISTRMTAVVRPSVSLGLFYGSYVAFQEFRCTNRFQHQVVFAGHSEAA
eukprot:2027833-Lingulodinium_polyedra.AAC.1